MRVPPDAPADVQQAFRDVWATLDRLTGAGGRNLDLRGRRVVNAGTAIGQFDGVTKTDLEGAQGASSDDAGSGVFLRITVRQLAEILGKLLLPRLTDGSKHHVVLWVDGSGFVSGVNDGGDCLAYNDVDHFLELGFDMKIKWVSALSEIGSPADGVITFSNNAGSGIRLVLGPSASASHPALKKSSAELQARLGDDSAYADFRCKNLTADNVPTTGAAADFTDLTCDTLVVGTDPGGGDPARVGGGIRMNGGVRISDSKIMKTDTSFSNGAGGSAGTLTNAPSAGDPSKWIPIDDNGTTRYIPAW